MDVNIRMLDDENRFYIVFNNPSAEEKVKALKLVEEMFGAKERVEYPDSVLPTKVAPVTVPDSAKEVKDESDLQQVYGIKDISSPKSFIECYQKYPRSNDEEKQTFITAGGKFLKSHIKKMDENNLESIKGFLMDFQPALSGSIKKILLAKGYNNLKGFLKTASEQEILAMYTQCKDVLYKGLKIA